MTPRYRTSARRVPVPGEVNDLPSECVPDPNLSLRDLLIRHTQGDTLFGRSNAVYNEEYSLPDPSGLDLIDRKDIYDRLDTILSRYDAENKSKKALEQREALRQEILDEIEKGKPNIGSSDVDA